MRTIFQMPRRITSESRCPELPPHSLDPLLPRCKVSPQTLICPLIPTITPTNKQALLFMSPMVIQICTSNKFLLLLPLRRTDPVCLLLSLLPAAQERHHLRSRSSSLIRMAMWILGAMKATPILYHRWKKTPLNNPVRRHLGNERWLKLRQYLTVSRFFFSEANLFVQIVLFFAQLLSNQIADFMVFLTQSNPIIFRITTSKTHAIHLSTLSTTLWQREHAS
jgi:hypothetical protein